MAKEFVWLTPAVKQWLEYSSRRFGSAFKVWGSIAAISHCYLKCFLCNVYVWDVSFRTEDAATLKLRRAVLRTSCSKSAKANHHIASRAQCSVCEI